jgi:hypothetical protein
MKAGTKTYQKDLGNEEYQNVCQLEEKLTAAYWFWRSTMLEKTGNDVDFKREAENYLRILKFYQEALRQVGHKFA